MIDDKYINVEDDYKTPVSLSLNDDIAFKNTVLDLLNKFPLEANRIKAKFKTNQTFDNSLGDIYAYLMDLSICKAHSDCKLHSCPKEQKGYKIELIYDENQDRLKVETLVCEKRDTLNKTFDKLIVSDYTNETIYDESIKFNNLLKEENRKDLITLVKYINTTLNIKKDKSHSLFSISTLKDDGLISLITSFLCYFYLKHDLYVSIIDSCSLFNDLNSYDTSINEAALDDLNKALRCDCLFFTNFNNPPIFTNTLPFLYKIIDKRINRGITIFATKSDYAFSSFINKMRKLNSVKSTYLNKLEKNVFDLKINDFIKG